MTGALMEKDAGLESPSRVQLFMSAGSTAELGGQGWIMNSAIFRLSMIPLSL